MLGLGLGFLARELLRPRYDLQGKTVVITGGSRGLGLLLARRFASEGANVVLAARDAQELERAHVELAQLAPVLSVTCDVAEPEGCGHLIDTARTAFGGIDVLVNDAGTMTVGPVEEMTLADFEDAMAIHFWAPLRLILEALPDLRERGGRVVNISSIGGVIPVPHLAPYVASKYALTGLSETLHAELSRAGVAVTTVCPGLMRTGSPRNAFFKGRYRAEYAWFKLMSSTPLTSMNADRAARRIVRACRRGEPYVILTFQAWLAARVHALAPGLFGDLQALIDRLLPRPGGIGPRVVPGHEAETRASRNLFTRLTDHAAVRNNELG